MTREEKITVCARAAHEMNRIYCKTLGDFSQAPWETAEGWQRTSAIKGVEGALAGNTPEQSHESWLKEKVATGWVRGVEKDPVKKTHPCMVPYDELPQEQMVKDYLFLLVVTAMAGALGLRATGHPAVIPLWNALMHVAGLAFKVTPNADVSAGDFWAKNEEARVNLSHVIDLLDPTARERLNDQARRKKGAS